MISQAINFAKSQCALGGSNTPLLDAQLLLQSVLNCDRQYLYMYGEKALSDEQWQAFRGLVEARRDGRPIAHLLGEREFWSLALEVNDSTLIPRPDTEIVVEEALKLALPENARILELGCGTGAISLALATERPDWRITALDMNADAVALAQRNADRHQLSGRIKIMQSDWFTSVDPGDGYDLILSNPPYIDPSDPHLTQGDVRFEPLTALVADEQGFADLYHIIATAPTYLSPLGWVLLEHGYQQAIKVAEFFSEKGYQKVNTAKDYANLDRVTFAQRG